MNAVTYLGKSCFQGGAASEPVSIQGGFETRPYNCRVDRLRLSIYMRSQRCSLKPAPTTVGWSVDLWGRSTGAVDVGAGFKPALACIGPSSPFWTRASAIGSTASP